MRTKAARLPVGFDTETHDGRAVLLCTPATALVEPRGWREVRDWLLDRGPLLVAWHVTYDSQAVLAWAPRRLLRRLATVGRADWEERDGRWTRLRWVPGKFFALSRGLVVPDARRPDARLYDALARRWVPGAFRSARSVTIVDALPYYQMGLGEAARSVLGEEKGDPGVPWSELKAALGDARRDRVVAYCQRDALLAEKLYAHVHGALSRLGPAPRRPVSPASWASSLFSAAMAPLPWRLSKAARRAYHGGRIEVFRRGSVERAWRYDLRSAYPSEEARLADARECLNATGRGAPHEEAVYGLYRVRVSIPPEVPYPPVPLRRRGEPTVYPCGRWTTWTDLHTARVLAERGWADRWGPKAEWYATGDARPFEEGVVRLYALRADPTLKQACKLVLNALYGKLAETRREWREASEVGWRRPVRWLEDGPWYLARETPGRRANVLYSLHVTAAVRLRLFRALEAAGDSALYCHTDSVAASRPLPLDVGPGLGQWGVEAEGEPCRIVGSGVYGWLGADGWDWSTRGFGWRDLGPLLEAAPDARELVVDDLRAASLLDLARSREPLWDALNVLAETPRALRLDFDRKRVWDVEAPDARALLAGSHGSRPWYWLP